MEGKISTHAIIVLVQHAMVVVALNCVLRCGTDGLMERDWSRGLFVLGAQIEKLCFVRSVLEIHLGLVERTKKICLLNKTHVLSSKKLREP